MGNRIRDIEYREKPSRDESKVSGKIEKSKADRTRREGVRKSGEKINREEKLSTSSIKKHFENKAIQNISNGGNIKTVNNILKLRPASKTIRRTGVMKNVMQVGFGKVECLANNDTSAIYQPGVDGEMTGGGGTKMGRDEPIS